MHAYIDETAYETDQGVPIIGSGVLVTAEPVSPTVVREALIQLEGDTDRLNPQTRDLDDATLERACFHASEDSKNAHSWLARQIHAHIKGSLLFSIARRGLQGDERQYRTQVLHNLVRALKTKRPVHIVFEERSGFSHLAAREVIETLYRALDASAYDLALLPTYYPNVTVSVHPKDDPGLQVVDLLLWATVQKIAHPGKAKAGVFDWCGLRFEYQEQR